MSHLDSTYREMIERRIITPRVSKHTQNEWKLTAVIIDALLTIFTRGVLRLGETPVSFHSIKRDGGTSQTASCAHKKYTSEIL